MIAFIMVVEPSAVWVPCYTKPLSKVSLWIRNLRPVVSRPYYQDQLGASGIEQEKRINTVVLSTWVCHCGILLLLFSFDSAFFWCWCAVGQGESYEYQVFRLVQEVSKDSEGHERLQDQQCQTSNQLASQKKKNVHPLCILTLSTHEAVYLWVSQKHLNRLHMYMKRQVVIANLQNPRRHVA